MGCSMTHAPDGLDVLAAAVVIIAVAVACWHARWARWDRERRSKRRCHVNLQRMIGGPK